MNDIKKLIRVYANAESIQERLSAYEAANIIQPKPPKQEVGV